MIPLPELSSTTTPLRPVNGPRVTSTSSPCLQARLGLELARPRLWNRRLNTLDLVKIQFHRGIAAEDGDEDLHLLLVRVHFLDGAGEFRKWAGRDPDDLALLPGRLRLHGA